MGYYSSGCIVITAPEEKMVAEISVLLLLDPRFRKPLAEEFKLVRTTNGLALILEYSEWKWYDSYEDIQLLEDIWKHFEDLHDSGDDAFAGRFIRLGENDDDLETREFGDNSWDLAYAVRRYEIGITYEDEDIRKHLQFEVPA